MADSATATVTPPPGYTVETQASNSGSSLPAGYTVEGQPTQGPSIGPQPSAENRAAGINAALPSEVQPLTMPLVKGLIAAHDKLRDVENMTQEGRAEHPIQARIGDLANRIEGLLTGNPTHPEAGIGTGELGILTNPITSSILPNPATGAPMLAEGIEAGANLVKSGVQAVRGAVSGGAEAEEAPGLVKQIIKGKGVAQEPARAALESGAKASAADAGVSASETAGKGIRTLLDVPIAKAARAERATYDAINKAAGTDLKSLYDYRSDLQDALEDPANIGQKANLQKELKTTEAAINNGEAQALKNGVDPSTVNKAKAMTQQRYAMETAKQKLFNNEAVVSGNVEHGAPETIKVDSAIRAVENLDKPSRFAPEGSPTRLVQAFGEKGAEALKQGLYDAQKAGQTALKKQVIAKWIGGILGAGALGGAAEKLLH